MKTQKHKNSEQFAHLVRVQTWAKQNKKTSSWAYKEIREGRVEVVVIDGVQFIDVSGI